MSERIAQKGGWQKLLTGTAIPVLLVSLLIGAAFFRPFLLVSVLIIIGFILTKRPGRIGTALILVAFIVTIVLNVGDPGTITTLKNPASPMDFIPRVLALGSSIAGILAALQVLAGAEGPSGAARKIGTAVTLLVLAGIGVSVYATATFTADESQENDTQIVAREFQFTDKQVQAIGSEVVIFFDNQDPVLHTITIDELGFEVAVPGGKSRRLALNAPRGVYDFYCRTHPDMKGKILVG